MIRTRFTEMFGLDYPIMSAPMAMHSGGTLATAVSKVGGLGSFGGINPKGPDWVREQVDAIRHATDRPFGIGFITAFLGFAAPLFDATLEAGAPVIALSFGDPTPWAAKAKAAGSKVICQVQNYDHAAAAVDAGADVLVAQGTEAGGHTGTMSLLPLLAGLVDHHPDTPVLAAGGIADGRTLAAALTAGADGAWLGTAFLATPEAVEIHERYKRLIVESDGADTVFTRAYDIQSGLPWPSEIGERVRRNRFTDEWAEREAELRASREGRPPPDRRPPSAEPDPDTDPVLYGQSAGSIRAVRPAAEVVREISGEAEWILRSRPGLITR